MKKIKCLLLCMMMMSAFAVGCGASFDITSTILEEYANRNSGIFSNVTDEYEDYDYIEGVYVVETDEIHVELWNFDTTENAKSWFSDNVDDLTFSAKSHSGTTTTTSGSYTIHVDDTCYRLLFCNDKGIYAYGNDAKILESVLTKLNIIQ